MRPATEDFKLRSDTSVFYETINCVKRDKTCVKKEILKMNESKKLLRNIVPDFLLIPAEPDSADCLSYCQSTPTLEGEGGL